MRFLLLFVCLLPHLPIWAQGTGNTDGEEQKRLVYFTDKSGTPYSTSEPLVYLSPKALQRRTRQGIPLTTRDLPVNPGYVAGLKQEGVTVWYTSRWFNAAVVQCTDEQLQELQALPFVKSTQTLNRLASSAEARQQQSNQSIKSVSVGEVSYLPTPEVGDYGLAYHQADMLGADDLHQEGFTGAGMTIAVFDAGFPEVDKLPAFSHLFENNQLKGSFDFVLNQENALVADAHGTSVLSTMAAYAPGMLVGTAYGADYLLLRTEDAATEHNIEEVNWLLAAEYADSAGADVINSSLGYTTFDVPSRSYIYEDMDGNTSLVSRAADYAAATGMLVVVSAGNEGNKTWRFISAPADADSVLAVGAVDSLGTKALFSSFGPTADGRIKPDVVALGQGAYFILPNGRLARGNGTSFAGPITAGFAATLWQAHPFKTNVEMLELIRKSGSNAQNPNNSIGYGIPSYSRTVTSLPKPVASASALITNPLGQEPIMLYLGPDWLQQPMEVQVLDATGRLIFRQSIAQSRPEQALNLAPRLMRSGLYLCRIRSGNKVVTLRFVKL